MLSDTQIQRLIDVANAACHKGAVVDARTIYEGVLALRPQHIPALVGMALSYIVVDDQVTAETLLKDVLAIAPEDADAQAMLGLSLLLAQKKEEAAAVLEPVAAGESAAAILAANLLEQARQ